MKEHGSRLQEALNKSKGPPFNQPVLPGSVGAKCL